jgi:hypothetical protein
MMAIVAFGLFVSGVTIWPVIWELKTAVKVVWGDTTPTLAIHKFVLTAIDGIQEIQREQPFMIYAADWLAFALIVLSILFVGAMKDPVRNIWVVKFGLLCCFLSPILAIICIPIRQMPLSWFWCDFIFTPLAALPLWIAWRDLKKAEANSPWASHQKKDDTAGNG